MGKCSLRFRGRLRFLATCEKCFSLKTFLGDLKDGIRSLHGRLGRSY
jgi:hypothetical protein